MESTFELVAVAFVRSTGGRMRILLAVDRDGVALFDGEPALLVEHRPGAAPEALVVEGADRIAPETFEHVQRTAGPQLVALIEGAFDEQGTFDGQLLLGRGVQVVAHRAAFEESFDG